MDKNSTSTALILEPQSGIAANCLLCRSALEDAAANADSSKMGRPRPLGSFSGLMGTSLTPYKHHLL